jgi:hypothetical protein
VAVEPGSSCCIMANGVSKGARSESVGFGTKHLLKIQLFMETDLWHRLVADAYPAQRASSEDRIG